MNMDDGYGAIDGVEYIDLNVANDPAFASEANRTKAKKQCSPGDVLVTGCWATY